MMGFRDANTSWLADLPAGRKENLYVDQVYYTTAFSKEIGTLIADFELRYGQVGMAVIHRMAVGWFVWLHISADRVLGFPAGHASLLS